MATLTLGTYCNGIFQGSLSPVTSATVYLAGTNTLATVYADETGTSMTNPLPTGVSVGSNGIDTAGNVRFTAAPGKYETLLPGGVRERTDIAADPADFSAHLDDPDAHGFHTYADSNFLALADLGQPGGAAQLDENGVTVTGQVLMTVST
jgi:hypothetical protein